MLEDVELEKKAEMLRGLEGASWEKELGWGLCCAQQGGEGVSQQVKAFQEENTARGWGQDPGSMAVAHQQAEMGVLGRMYLKSCYDEFVFFSE